MNVEHDLCVCASVRASVCVCWSTRQFSFYKKPFQFVFDFTGRNIFLAVFRGLTWSSRSDEAHLELLKDSQCAGQ